MTKETMILLGGVAIGIFSSLIPVFKKLVVKSESKVDDTLLELSIKAVEFVEIHFLNKKGEAKSTIAKEIVERELKSKGQEIADSVIEKAINKAWASNELKNIEVDKGK